MQERYTGGHYSVTNHIAIDDYVIDSLLPDLVGHDGSPPAFLVYIVLWTELYRQEQRRISISLQQLSWRTGLSKSGVQAAIRLLKFRGLIAVTRRTATSTPSYELIRHWVRRRAKKL